MFRLVVWVHEMEGRQAVHYRIERASGGANTRFVSVTHDA